MVGQIVGLPTENVVKGCLSTERRSLRNGKWQKMNRRRMTRGELATGVVMTELLPGDWEWGMRYEYWVGKERRVTVIPTFTTSYEKEVECVKELVAFKEWDGWVVTWGASLLNKKCGILKFSSKKRVDYVAVNARKGFCSLPTFQGNEIQELEMKVRRGRQWSRWRKAKLIDVIKECEEQGMKQLGIGMVVGKRKAEEKTEKGASKKMKEEVEAEKVNNNAEDIREKWTSGIKRGQPKGKIVVDYERGEEYEKQGRLKKRPLRERKVNGINGTCHRASLFFPSVVELEVEYDEETRSFRSRLWGVQGQIFEDDSQMNDIRKAVEGIARQQVIMFDTESCMVNGGKGQKNRSELSCIQVGYKEGGTKHVFVFLWGRLKVSRKVVSRMVRDRQEWVGFSTHDDQRCLAEISGVEVKMTDVQGEEGGRKLGLWQAWRSTLASENQVRIGEGMKKIKECVHFFFKTGAWCLSREGQLFGEAVWGQAGLMEYAIADVWMLFDLWEEEYNMTLIME
jgi:hypothetical protein